MIQFINGCKPGTDKWTIQRAMLATEFHYLAADQMSQNNGIRGRIEKTPEVHSNPGSLLHREDCRQSAS
jgi:hypothetical protein